LFVFYVSMPARTFRLDTRPIDRPTNNVCTQTSAHGYIKYNVQCAWVSNSAPQKPALATPAYTIYLIAYIIVRSLKFHDLQINPPSVVSYSFQMWNFNRTVF
jgi:hypothetical protein